jgi:hypothetical protein
LHGGGGDGPFLCRGVVYATWSWWLRDEHLFWCKTIACFMQKLLHI